MKTIIVAGITRSGLTLTMQMLYVGGYPCFGEYPAFENYSIGEIPFKGAIGKAIKVVDTQIQFPPSGNYHVIRLRRNQKEQAKSMCKMIKTFMNLPITSADRNSIQKSLNNDYKKIDDWAMRQNGFMIMDFEDLILNSRSAAEKIKQFVDEDLNIENMIKSVKKRGTDCYPTMMEVDFINSNA